jgi:hypothetical protein
MLTVKDSGIRRASQAQGLTPDARTDLPRSAHAIDLDESISAMSPDEVTLEQAACIQAARSRMVHDCGCSDSYLRVKH